MENFELMKQGAEAKIYKGIYLGKPAIAKVRFEKQYRHSELDKQLTKERIKSESRAISRCHSIGIPTPMLYIVDMKKSTIIMEHFPRSITAKEFINNSCFSLVEKLSYSIGRLLGKMHKSNIVHGDLTTSNILLVNTLNKDEYTDFANLKIVFIDFGLAHLESSTEEKGVDLYLLERALLSTHNTAENIFPLILDAYEEEYKKCQEVFAKFDEVRTRGRKRTMVG